MAKKSFKGHNPAMDFISAVNPEGAEETAATPTNQAAAPTNQAATYRPAPGAVETKTQRVQLLLQPSVVEALKKTATEMGLSMNEAASRAIKEFIEKEGSK